MLSELTDRHKSRFPQSKQTITPTRWILGSNTGKRSSTIHVNSFLPIDAMGQMRLKKGGNDFEKTRLPNQSSGARTGEEPPIIHVRIVQEKNNTSRVSKNIPLNTAMNYTMPLVCGLINKHWPVDFMHFYLLHINMLCHLS